MEQIKKWYRSIPLWLGFFLMILIALLFAGAATRITTSTAYQTTANIQSQYSTADVIPSDGDIVYRYEIDDHFDEYTSEDLFQYRFLTFIAEYAAAFWYSIFVFGASLLFYFTKLKTPLALLHNASERISQNDFAFSVEYTGNDEMAKLCTAFDTMREALDESNQKMRRMIDERKQLNDAYTHDLRTPIAVLRGYADMLKKYVPIGKLSTDEVMETVNTMSTHVSRLEQFVESMNAVQKLDDVTIDKTPVPANEFFGHLEEAASILCQSHGLHCEFEKAVSCDTLCVDSAAVIQVYENLLSNAIRYAKEAVTIRCTYANSVFSVIVSDDGNGFSEKDLTNAAKPYYSGAGQKQEYHFGLGLHICRILCEKHGGSLELQNMPQGGAQITARFSTKLGEK